MSEQVNPSNLVDSTEARSLLANVLLVTKSMLACAEKGDWDEVTRMEAERRAFLGQAFAESISEKEATLVYEALAAMLHMNEELISLLEIAKADVAIKRTDQKRTRSSLTHYLDIESSH